MNDEREEILDKYAGVVNLGGMVKLKEIMESGGRPRSTLIDANIFLLS